MSDVFDRFDSGVYTKTERQNWKYFRLKYVRTRDGTYGRFIKMMCAPEDGVGDEIDATTELTLRGVLAYYVEALEAAIVAGLPENEYPLVPLYQTDTGSWRFSWHGALHDHPELREKLALKDDHPPAEVTKPAGESSYHHSDDDVLPYRMQVTITRALANRFKAVAEKKGQTHTELLLEMIRKTACGEVD